MRRTSSAAAVPSLTIWNVSTGVEERTAHVVVIVCDDGDPESYVFTSEEEPRIAPDTPPWPTHCQCDR